MPRTNSSPRLFDPTIIDAASLYEAVEVLSERAGRKITLDYSALKEATEELRDEHTWRSASTHTALLSVDPNSEGQKRFEQTLQRSGFETDVMHYRDTFVSLPPGRSPGDFAGKPMKSLASRIAYITGLMARHPNTHYLVVSHAFELYGPLTDLQERLDEGNGRVGLAYFGSLLDYRWRAAGLFNDGAPIEFFDLDRHAERLLGVDLGVGPRRPVREETGLSRF